MFVKKYVLCVGIFLSYATHSLSALDQKITNYQVRAVVLAAGKSTRFKTQKSKLLHQICGREMVLHPLKILNELNIPTTLVLGHQASKIQNLVSTTNIKQITYALQDKLLGTGYAVACAQQTWSDAQDILILYGDMPLVNKDIIKQIINEHINKKATLTFTTCILQDPQRYGRVINTNGHYEIVEAKDCTPEQLKITTINAGIYIVNQQWLSININNIIPSKISNEFYLTDIVKMATDQNKFVQAITVPFSSIQGANTLQELAEIERIKNTEIIQAWMNTGVRFEIPSSTLIDMDVIIGPDSIIKTGAQLRGKTTIGKETTIDAYSIIQDSIIGDNCSIGAHAIIHNMIIDNNTNTPPLSLIAGKV